MSQQLNSLKEDLNLALKLLPTTIVKDEFRAKFLKLADSLPPTHWLGFEIRLSSESDQIDFHQGIERADNVYAFFNQNGFNLEKETLLQFLKFINHWQDPQNTTYKHIKHLILEYDIIQGLATPSIFLGFDDNISRKEKHQLIQTLDIEFEISARNQAIIEAINNWCNGDEDINYLGLMLGRSQNVLRVNIKKISPNRIKSLLKLIGYSFDKNPLLSHFNTYQRYLEHSILCFDLLDGQVQPKVGIELIIPNGNNYNAGIASFIENILKCSMEKESKISDILAWKGLEIPSKSNISYWPEKLLAQSLNNTKSTFTTYQKHINHIKANIWPDGQIEHKIYIGFKHSWLDKKPELNTQIPKTNKTGVSKIELSNSINKAAAFLCMQRNPAGWLQDYTDIHTPHSDEWMMAFVGHKLSKLGDKYQMVAMELLENILTINRPTEGYGWGYTISADSDVSSWVMNLIKELKIGIGSEKINSLSHFINTHQCSNGGVASYLESIFCQYNVIFDHTKVCFETLPCVTAITLPYLVNQELAINYLLEDQTESGCWTSHWWPDHEYTTQFVVEALATYKPDSLAIQKASDWAVSKVDENGAVYSQYLGKESPFCTAACLKIILLSKQNTEITHKMAKWLVNNQNYNGSWQSSATLRMIDRDRWILDNKAIYSSAAIMDSLNLYLNLLTNE